ncbi:hypothetical protein SAMN05444162_1186 [Paenibacillaceae bacterium GAS479]|nr:hypothetical protein SAMN05444162_1186 [Paenibacillaceae bacterium GAS479]
MNFRVILVLFILLVVVTSLISGKAVANSPENGSVSALNSQGFDVHNNSSRIYFVFVTSDGNISNPTDPVLVANNGYHHYELKLGNIFLSDNLATIYYDAYNMQNEKVGELQINFLCRIVQFIKHNITTVLVNTAPVNTSTDSISVTITDL